MIKLRQPGLQRLQTFMNYFPLIDDCIDCKNYSSKSKAIFCDSNIHLTFRASGSLFQYEMSLKGLRISNMK